MGAWRRDARLRKALRVLDLFRVGGYALAVVGLIGLGAWAFLQGIQEEPAVLGALATAASAIVVVSLQQRAQRRDAIKEARREQLVPLYEGITTQMRTLAKAPSPTPELEAFMAMLQDKLVIWGPAPVVKAWVDAIRVFESEPDPSDALLAYATLLRAIREDLDHDDSQLDTRDLLRLFVTDIDDHLPPSRPSS
jgi:hypothetical protein